MSPAGGLPVLVLRPEPGASTSLKAAQELGLEAHSFPLFAIAPRAWSAPAREEIDALLLGSANALRHAGSALAAFRGLPAYAVGASTAQAAREAGLEVVETGQGGLQSLLGKLDPGHVRLLRLAGRERVALECPAGVGIATRVVYASNPTPAPEALRRTLARPAIALLHSGEAARRFEALCSNWDISRKLVHLAAIGPRVVAGLGPGWASVQCAAVPSDAALLALAARMCQDVISGSIQADNQT